MKTTKNAKIQSTQLGYEDHGILTFQINVDYGGTAQGFGGYAIGGLKIEKVIGGILKTVGVENWEHLIGKPVRVVIDNGIISALMHYLDDSKCFDFK